MDQTKPTRTGVVNRLRGRGHLIIWAAIAALAIGLLAATGGTVYALRLEENDAFCASCHTEPETRYYNQSAAPGAATLAAFHAHKDVRCIDCHSAGGTFGRADGLMQGAHDLLTFYSGRYHSPAITTSPLGDDSCLKCHADVTTRRSFNNHFHFFLARWQSTDANAASCIDCHGGHPETSASVRFMQPSRVNQVCQDCHQALSEGE